MCGIFASFGSSKKHHELDVNTLKAATEAVNHRGPNNTSHFIDTNAFLGHTRLSIIDTASHANQPYQYASLVMSFNGEIYNYLELREELLKAGYEFDTHSDTEVLIKAFHYWKEKCFAKLNGMWALAIYNKEEKTLVVSRDRFGQKPLYFMSKDGLIYIASELHQLTSFSDKKINYSLVQNYLKEGGFENDNTTFFNDVEIFPKAHYGKFHLDSDKVELTRYWAYPESSPQKTFSNSYQNFDELLEDAVKLRLRCDVPFSIMLSGGVDSSIIASKVRKLNPDLKLQAFTYSSKDSEDETQYAKKIADSLDINLTTREQDDDPQNYIKRLKILVKHMGRCHSSPAVVSIDYLYEAVSKSGSKVALDGQGADELLAGYEFFHPLLFPIFLLKGQYKQAYLLLKSWKKAGFLKISMYFLRASLNEPLKAIGRRLYGYEKLFAQPPKKANQKKLTADATKKSKNSIFNKFLIKQHQIGLENLLFYGDIVAMNHSIENRSPFMDYRLVDFAFSHDEALKVRDGKGKFVLRTLPEYQRFKNELERKKIGFSSNIKTGTKEKMNKDLKSSPILKWPIFSENFYKQLSSNTFLQPKYERLLFRLYQIHLWEEIFIQEG